jgi:hypothetical protein
LIQEIINLIHEFIKDQPNEFVMLLIGVGVWIFIVSNRAGLKRLPYYGIIMIAFYLLLVTWIATVLEHFIWGDFLNLVEHVGLAASSVLTAVWCWKVFAGRKKAG